MTYKMKDLDLNDMKYIESVIAEEFGHKAMIYHISDKLSYLNTPIELPHNQGKLLAIGMWGEEDSLLLKVETIEGKTIFTNAIEI